MIDTPALRFIGLCGLGLLAVSLLPSIVAPLAQVTAACTAALWSYALATPIWQTGQFLRFEQSAVQIDWECTTLLPSILYVSALVSTPASLVPRLAGIAIGLSVMFGINMLRIGGLVLVLANRPAWFEACHTSIWQSVTFLELVVLYTIWVTRCGPHVRR